MFLAGLACAAPEYGIDQQAAFNASQAVIGKQIGDYQLRDQNGKSVRLSDYRGTPLLVSFIYTGCFQSCPGDTLLISRATSAVHDVLGINTFKTVSIGFNVPFDTPEAMAAFAHQRGIAARNWDFLSPDRATVDSLTRDFGFMYVATPKGFDHVTQLTVVDRNGKIFRQLYGDSLNAQAIMSTLRDMENGAPPVAQGWSGVMARIRLLCTIYDSSTGTYRADYSLIVGMLVGASILGSVAWLLFSEWRRSRRLKPL
jgi:protein SCO1/2